jgi:hypothetical protein
MGETARILKEDGLLVMVYWNLFSLRGVFHHMRTLVTGGEAFYRRPYSTWKRKMATNGFRCVYEEGFCWSPFRRESNSGLVPYVTAVEGQLGLRRLPAISPWVVTILQKRSTR